MKSRRGLGLAGLPLLLAIVAGCSTASATPILRFSPVDSAAATGTDAVAGASAAASATDMPSPSTMETMTPAIAITAPPTAAAAASARVPVAWVHGQTVKQYALVAPGVGWVWTTTGLWQTTNDGATWLDAYPHRLHLDAVRGMTALDANHALLAAVDEGASTSTYYIWHTSNAGLTWAYSALPAIPHDIHPPGCAPGDFCGAPGDPAAVMDFVDANTAFVTIGMRNGFDGLQSHIFGTTDGGLHWSARAWTPALLPSGPDPLERVQFTTPTMGVVEGSYEFSSTATGWGHWSDRLLSDIFYNPTISFISSGNWMAGGGLDSGTVHYRYAISTDHGASWGEHLTSVPGLSGLSDAQLTFLTSTEWIGTCMTSGGPSTTVYTVDGGAHFAMYGPQPFNGSNATFIDANHGWAGPINPTLDAGTPTTKVWTTSDRGLHWMLITP